MATLLRVDKNGTKYWGESKCPKCGGTGYLYGYEHIDGGRCWKCGGTGIYEHSWKEYTPEYARKLTERRFAKARKGADEANAKWFAKEGFSAEGKDLWDIIDGYVVCDIIGLGRENWAENPKYWCEQYAHEIGIECSFM